MSEKNGGPAFPGPDQAEQTVDINEGMTLRDYFAAKAMRPLTQNMTTARKYEMEAMTKEAYAIADAMLRARDA